MAAAGIEPATFRFVEQHLNHCSTAVLYMKRKQRKLRLKIVYSNWDFVGSWSAQTCSPDNGSSRNVTHLPDQY